MEQEDKKLTFEFSKKKFRNFWCGLIFAPPVFLGALGRGFRFGGWYHELAENQRTYVLLGCGEIVFVGIIYYFCLIRFLVKYYKEEDRKNYFYCIVGGIIWSALNIFVWTLYSF